jgi:hypothetical protein
MQLILINAALDPTGQLAQNKQKYAEYLGKALGAGRNRWLRVNEGMMTSKSALAWDVASF